MAHNYQTYDPAKQPGNPNYVEYRNGLEAVPPAAPGPGGRTTNVENNEKGIQETELFQVMAHNPKRSPLTHNGPEYRQGIYAQDSLETSY